MNSYRVLRIAYCVKKTEFRSQESEVRIKLFRISREENSNVQYVGADLVSARNE
jgi:hypothetical protein